MYPLMIFAMVK